MARSSWREVLNPFGFVIRTEQPHDRVIGLPMQQHSRERLVESQRRFRVSSLSRPMNEGREMRDVNGRRVRHSYAAAAPRYVGHTGGAARCSLGLLPEVIWMVRQVLGTAWCCVTTTMKGTRVGALHC